MSAPGAREPFVEWFETLNNRDVPRVGGNNAMRPAAARTLTVQTTRKERESFVLSDDEILQLGRWAATVEAHYGHAMDMEWAKDGETDELYLVQARPETVVSTRRAG